MVDWKFDLTLIRHITKVIQAPRIGWTDEQKQSLNAVLAAAEREANPMLQSAADDDAERAHCASAAAALFCGFGIPSLQAVIQTIYLERGAVRAECQALKPSEPPSE